MVFVGVSKGLDIPVNSLVTTLFVKLILFEEKYKVFQNINLL
jgi:hypothetical protein